MKPDGLTMTKIISLAALVSLLLVVSQVMLKSYFMHANFPKSLSFSEIFDFMWAAVTHWLPWCAGVFLLASGCLWIFLMGKAPLSMIYPLVSISYIFMLFADKLVFNQPFTLSKCLGTIVICIGVSILVR